MLTSNFDYHLPKELIAQEPAEPRDHSRLLVLDRKNCDRQHRRFFEIGEFLRRGDLLVLNVTKVFKARLFGTLPSLIRANRRIVEILLVRPTEYGWIALAKPRKKLRLGTKIYLQQIVLDFRDREKHVDTILEVMGLPEDGTVLVKPSVSDAELIEFANLHGEIPIPPYIKKMPEKLETYQTIFARETGSVAAPTAAFHFTPDLVKQLEGIGIQFVRIILHVGLGTFMPVKTATLEEHPMHSEVVEISEQTAWAINTAKREGRRVIAVGTTTTRALEAVASLRHLAHQRVIPSEAEGSWLTAYRGDVNLFIKPGFEFKVIDGLITNFHLPKSTLLALVSAFAGRECILGAYAEAISQKYRFFSFGDAMLIS